MNTIRFVAALMAVALASIGLRAADASVLTDVDVRRESDLLSVAIDVDAARIQPGRDREVLYTPVVRAAAGTDSVVLPSFVVAGRNRYYSHIRNNDLPAGRAMHLAGSGEAVAYRESTPFMSWMAQAVVVLREEVSHCCDAPLQAPETPLARLDYEPPVYVPVFRFVELTGDSVVERTAEGKAFVDFVVNRTEIRPDYRGNRKEIAKIIASIDKVKNDPDAVITRITIKGFASPEGSYQNNIRLAMGRTASLKEYVREHYNFNPEIMSTDYEPEDWEGLYAFLDTCGLTHRDELVQIARSALEPDARDAEMRRRYPAEYKYILEHVYPGLRHSDYTVRYRFRDFTSIEELKRVYAAAPDRLRPVDFQRIAATYASDSPEYADVYTTAAAVHPFDPECNLNAATVALRTGRMADAERYLARAGDTAEAVYTRGVRAGMCGDLERAEQLFAAAAGMGLAEARTEAERLAALRNRATVEYLVKTAGKQ